MRDFTTSQAGRAYISSQLRKQGLRAHQLAFWGVPKPQEAQDNLSRDNRVTTVLISQLNSQLKK